MADYVTDGKIGIDLTATYASTSAGSIIPWPARPGDRVHTNNNGCYMFARAQSDISQFACVVFGSFADSAVSSDSTRMPTVAAVPMTTTNAVVGGVGGDGMVGIAQTSIASSYYGWIALNGSALRVNTLVACQPKVPLYTTSTAGSLDDATVSSGYVSGITINTSATSASAPWCVANWPKIIHAQTSST